MDERLADTVKDKFTITQFYLLTRKWPDDIIIALKKVIYEDEVYTSTPEVSKQRIYGYLKRLNKLEAPE